MEALDHQQMAEQIYQQILKIDPRHDETLNRYGMFSQAQGRPGKAVELYRSALAYNPQAIPAMNNLGLTLLDQDKVQEAEKLFLRAIALNSRIAELYNGLGLTRKAQRRFDEAMQCFKQAIKINPDYAEAHWNLGWVQLMKGDYRNGWREYDWRWRMKSFVAPDLSAPVWKGEDLQGKSILLHCEQGLGDSIHFIRYAAMVKALGTCVIVPTPAPLVPLFRNVKGIDVLNQIGEPIPHYDYHASLMSLPGIFDTTVETILADIPYLHPDQAKIDSWHERLKSLTGLKIGIVWRGNPTYMNDRNRSMPAENFAPILKLKGLSVIVLQKDAREDEIAALDISPDTPFLNAGPELHDFQETAALVKNLDLVLTVDTSVCHLAGALGQEVWTLAVPDWRWLEGREDTPWYPGMRLFMQPASGEWPKACENVRNALQAKLQKRENSPV